MNATIEELEDKFLVTLEGELDTAAAADVENKLQPLYTANGKDVVIDCSQLEYIASSGLRILIRVTISGMNDDIKDVFKLTGFINLFEFA